MSERRKNRWGPVDEKDNKKITRKSFQTALRIFGFLKPYRIAFFTGLLCLLISTLISLSFPYLMGKLIDTGLQVQSNTALTAISQSINSTLDNSFITTIFSNTNLVALFLVGLLLFQAAISYFRIYFFATVTEKSMADVRMHLYDKLITLSIPFFEERRVGELTSRSTNDVDQLQDMLSMTLPEFIRQVLTIVLGIGWLFYTSAKLTFLMISTFPILVILAVVYGKYIRKISKNRQDALANSNVIVEETMQNINTVKAFSNEAYESMRYRKNMFELIRTGIKGAIARGGFTTFLILGLFGGFVLVLWYGATLLQSGDITAGELVSFMMYTLFIGGSVGGLGDLYGRLQKTVGASERIFEILDTDGEFRLPDKKSKIYLHGAIHFDDVHFSYPTRKDIAVLNGISFKIKSGEKIALAGQSGAGKSTIAQLLLKFYNPGYGQIYVDGKNISDYDVRAYRDNISIVPQEVILFGGTIRENILYGKPDANDEEIRTAAKKANAWNFISAFPDGLETIVGERGIKLSGGQRQRIAIARAILKDPAILILDEATSSLDSESEMLVQLALDELMQNRTTVIIAHRLSTIRNADCIFVMEKGKIVEQGTFEELSKMDNGVFGNLLKLQFNDMERSIDSHNIVS
jgi:ABC-type multidrug transport system fused ATPase/permease subunit